MTKLGLSSRRAAKALVSSMSVAGGGRAEGAGESLSRLQDRGGRPCWGRFRSLSARAEALLYCCSEHGYHIY